MSLIRLAAILVNAKSPKKEQKFCQNAQKLRLPFDSREYQNQPKVRNMNDWLHPTIFCELYSTLD